jgi:2-polyprenyl-3-methyl-5-hydroxy-6-metoxy-1,4-benzoquinol methylase
MMLTKRDPDARERMDDADCDRDKLYKTYRQFHLINAFLSRTKSIYRGWLKPAMAAAPHQPYSLLDIGFGGGDIALKLAAWAKHDGFDLHITAIDIDQRAYDYVHTLDWPENVVFRLLDAHTLASGGERFDFVISNHMVHHLGEREFDTMLEDAATLCRRCVLFIDLRRSLIAYYTFALATLPFFRDSYIRGDGLASLRRSYTFSELNAIAPPDWTLIRLFPFRLILSYQCGAKH